MKAFDPLQMLTTTYLFLTREVINLFKESLKQNFKLKICNQITKLVKARLVPVYSILLFYRYSQECCNYPI